MARYIGPKAKLSRREGTDLFLKSARRSLADKCKLDSKPGQHGRTSGARTSDYGNQLREKQKVKRIYGVLERQFRRYFAEADRRRATRAKTCCNCSNRVWTTSCIAWASARRALKRVSWSSHKAITVNGVVSNIASMQVKAGDVVAVREKSKKQVRILEALSLAEQGGMPSWVSVDSKKFEGTFKSQAGTQRNRWRYQRKPDRRIVFAVIGLTAGAPSIALRKGASRLFIFRLLPVSLIGVTSRGY